MSDNFSLTEFRFARACRFAAMKLVEREPNGRVVCYLGASLKALVETGEGKPFADDSEDNIRRRAT